MTLDLPPWLRNTFILLAILYVLLTVFSSPNDDAIQPVPYTGAKGVVQEGKIWAKKRPVIKFIGDTVHFSNAQFIFPPTALITPEYQMNCEVIVKVRSTTNEIMVVDIYTCLPDSLSNVLLKQIKLNIILLSN